MEYENIFKINKIVKYIRENVTNDLALPQLAIYLTVCRDEGITMPELRERLGMPQGSLSRNIKRLSKYYEGEKIQGYDLLTTIPDIHERKKLAVYLTDQGKALREELNNLLS